MYYILKFRVETYKKYLFGKDRMIQQVPGTCKISILCLQLHVSLKDEIPKRNEGNIPTSSNAMLNKISSIRCSWERFFFSSVILLEQKFVYLELVSPDGSRNIYFYISLHCSLRQLRIKD